MGEKKRPRQKAGASPFPASEFFAVPKRFAGQAVFIVAGGPSVTAEALAALRGRPVIAINSSYEACPFAEYVFAMDYQWVRHHKARLIKEFSGRVITTTRMENWPGLLRMRKILRSGLATKTTEVTGRRTSLTSAINIAVHLGGNPIVLLGADGGKAKDGRTHHHTPHPWWKGKKKNPWDNMAAELQGLVRPLKDLGIKIVNTSTASKWGYIFPVMPLDVFLASEKADMDKSESAYRAAYERELANVYPAIDAIERRCAAPPIGTRHAIRRIEEMALSLACPLKVNPPNWQHGRLLYAVFSNYLRGREHDEINAVDVGTAKGFSALCLASAIDEASSIGHVISIDVIDPLQPARRNSIAETSGPKTLAELVQPFVRWTKPEGRELWGLCSFASLQFVQAAAMTYLAALPTDMRINFAFIDGKHKLTDVRAEAEAIKARQRAYDLIVFDDVQIAPVLEAVKALKGYTIEFIDPTGGAELVQGQFRPAIPMRCYAVAEKLP